MFRWIKSYLHNRRARVVIDNTKSKKILLRHGVPQGGAISQTLFLVFINDLIKKCPSPVKCAMYADDLVLLSTEEYATTAKVRLQEVTNILSSWAQDRCVKINTTIIFTTLFTLSTKSKPMKIMLDDTELQHTDSATHWLEPNGMLQKQCWGMFRSEQYNHTWSTNQQHCHRHPNQQSTH